MNTLNYIDYESISENLTKIFFSKKKSLTIDVSHNFYKGNFIKINSYGELLIKEKNDIKTISYGEIL